MGQTTAQMFLMGRYRKASDPIQLADSRAIHQGATQSQGDVVAVAGYQLRDGCRGRGTAGRDKAGAQEGGPGSEGLSTPAYVLCAGG